MTDHLLSDEHGPVLACARRERKGVPLADDAVVVPGRTADEAAAAARAELAGWRLTTADPDLAGALISAGSTLRRRALLMQSPLAAAPVPDPRPLIVQDLPRTSEVAAWAPMLPSWRAAFPPGHVDHIDGDDTEAVAFLMMLVDGTHMGVLHRSSCLLADAEGTPVAGILVNVQEEGSRFDGPWVSDLWRDPSLRATGTGRLLLDRARALLAEDGYDRLTLAVTVGNDAVRSYERCGFKVVMDAWMLYVTEAPD